MVHFLQLLEALGGVCMFNLSWRRTKDSLGSCEICQQAKVVIGMHQITPIMRANYGTT